MMKDRLMAFSALALLAGATTNYGKEERLRVEPDTEGQIYRRKLAVEKVMQRKGLKWFTVDGVWVQALNQKNAERKAKKLKL